MKSNEEDLRKRGMAGERDIKLLENLSTEDLFEKINSPIAAERSAATILLRSRCEIDNKDYILLLLERLEKEKSLYTKIELCNTLEKGNITTALVMCNYLGKIGNNQYLTIADTVSKKKSFPLQRDIIARTLSRMDKIVFPVLLEQLDTLDKAKVAELLDAIGYMAFYNPDLANPENFRYILHTYEKYEEDILIIWKIALCCSGFSIKESIELLNNIQFTYTHPTVKAESERSLKLIKLRHTGI